MARSIDSAIRLFGGLRSDLLYRRKLEKRVQVLRERVEGRAARFSTTGVRGCNDSNGTEERLLAYTDEVAKLEALDRQIRRNRDQCTEVLRIMGERSELAQLLRCRYLFVQNWEQVAESIMYTVRWCHKLHLKALAEASKIIDEHISPMVQ